MQERIPAAAIVGSLGVHAAVLGAYFYLAHSAAKKHAQVVSNVDLIFQAPKPLVLPHAAAPVKLNVMNFLKMALPEPPKMQLQNMQVKIPETPKTLLQETPKLDEREHLHEMPKMESLGPEAHPINAAALSAGEPALERHGAALANLPALEEVGTRQVQNLPQAMALEEKRREASVLEGLSAAAPARQKENLGGTAPLEEALPSQETSRPQGLNAEAPLPAAQGLAAPAAPEAPPATLGSFISSSPGGSAQPEVLPSQKKGVEIEGPLAHRKVLYYSVPPFPDWARDQGILEADVAVRFWVSPEGDVMSDMRIERSSGYGQLDRLAMETLKKWKFSPLEGEEKQWGVITFRFVLE